jgi:O-glycosyl hydrolase
MRFTFTAVAALAVIAHSAQAAITIDANSQLRRIDGFGFSQAFGRAKEFQNAASGLQKQALDYLFSTTTGAGFSIIRNRIGSGGQGDSIEPSSPGSPSASPKYSWDNDDKGQVWFTKQAVSYGVRTIYADAWSAPGFMKTSGNEATAGLVVQLMFHFVSNLILFVLVGTCAERQDTPAVPGTGGRHTQTSSSSTSSTTLRLASPSLILAS